MISDNEKQKILDNTDIVSEIGKFVALKKSGKDYIGLCPFHEERTASFTVSPSKQKFHCFGCHKGGHVINFIQLHNNLSYPEAAKYLAHEAGITLSRTSKKKQQQIEIEINAYQINELAKNAFLKMLLSNEEYAQQACRYLRERGIEKETSDFFNIGYAPPGGKWLKDKLDTQEGFVNKAINLGLLTQKQLCSFYRRLIFPIHNKQGKVSGFAGRTIGDNNSCKYINSSNSEVFQKSQLLYGLYENLETIRNSKNVIIVEGYIDVLALYQEGKRNVVGLCGTALSEYHANELKKEKIVTCILCLDADEGGVRAVRKSVSQLFSKGLLVKVAVLPKDEDPASYINKNGIDSFEDDIIEFAKSPIDFIYNIFTSESYEPEDVGWVELTSEYLCEIVACLPKARKVAVEQYTQQIEKMTTVSFETLTSIINLIREKNDKATIVQGEKTKAKRIKSNNVEEIQDIISSQNLLLAWRKVKHFAQTHDVYFDSKLFEQFEKRSDEYLFVLQRKLEIMVEDLNPYQPEPLRQMCIKKPQGGVREIAVPTSIQDRIVIQAILNVVAPVIEETFSKNSFGHRLSKKFAVNELIFERWQNLYGEYQSRLRQFLWAPAHCYYLKADIAKFYDQVNRTRLQDEIRNVCKFVQNEWTFMTIDSFINYHWIQYDGKTDESGPYGLPQGPAYGHFFANLYLAGLDRFVESNIKKPEAFKPLGYCRYVDDMFLLFDSAEEAKRGQEVLSYKLKQIGLDLSEEKTKIIPVTDQQPIIDEMKSKKYSLGKLLDNDENLEIQQREILYSAIEEDYLQIKSSADIADVSKHIPFLVSRLSQTEYFKEKQAGLTNLVIELLFSESFKHSSIGGILKRTLPTIVKNHGAKSFAKYLHLPETPDFKRILFLQAVEENNFYNDLGDDLQKTIHTFLKHRSDFVRFAAANCLFANQAILSFKEVRKLVKEEKNQEIMSRLLHMIEKKCTERYLPDFLGIQAKQNEELAYHALLVTQYSLPDTARNVIKRSQLNSGPILVELLYLILRNGSREAMERLEAICENKGESSGFMMKFCAQGKIVLFIADLLQIILSKADELYNDRFIDPKSIMELTNNLSFLQNERIKASIFQQLIKPIAARISQEEEELELDDELKEFEEKFINTEHDVARYMISVKEGANTVAVGFLNERGVSYEAYYNPQSESLDLFETIEERYITETGVFNNIYDWLDSLKEALDDQFIYYTKAKPFEEYGVRKVVIHYHLDSAHVRICDLLKKERHIGEVELASFISNMENISSQLQSKWRRAPTISPYNIIVDASLKPFFINLGTVFCNPRYISTSKSNERDLSPSHDSKFLGWLSFEMLTNTCPLNEIKTLVQTDAKRKYLTSSPKLAHASLFYTRILRRLTYDSEDHRRPLNHHSNRQLIDDYNNDLQTLQKLETQGFSGGKSLIASLLMFWSRRIIDAWTDPNLAKQGNTVRIIQSYCRIMEDTITFQKVKGVIFFQPLDFEVLTMLKMHVGSAFLDCFLNQIEQLQDLCNNNSTKIDRRINFIIMYLTVRIELIAYVNVVNAKNFSNWSKSTIAEEFANTENKPSFLTKQLAKACGIELKANEWKAQLEFLSTDIAIMLGKKVQDDFFTKTGLSGLYAFILLCSDENERDSDRQNVLKTVFDWEKKITSGFRQEKALSKTDYAELQSSYHYILKNLTGSSTRVKGKLKSGLIPLITQDSKVLLDEHQGEVEVKVTDIICTTNNLLEKSRKKGEIISCDLLNGKVVVLSAVGYYEQQILKTENKQKQDSNELIISQGNNGIAVANNKADVYITINKNITSDKVYIHPSTENSGIDQCVERIVIKELPEPNNVE